MGISEKLSQLAGQVHDGMKESSKSFAGLILKVITGFFIGLTVALIAQEVFAYGSLLFVFTMIVIGAIIFRIIANWSLVSTLVFDLVVILFALLLRMYILMAP